MRKQELQERLTHKVWLDEMMATNGWKLIEEHLANVEMLAVNSLTTNTDNHAHMAKRGGELGVVLMLRRYIANTLKQGTEALQELKKRNSDTSSEDE